MSFNAGIRLAKVTNTVEQAAIQSAIAFLQRLLGGGVSTS
jgi:hypothetical protein